MEEENGGQRFFQHGESGGTRLVSDELTSEVPPEQGKRQIGQISVSLNARH